MKRYIKILSLLLALVLLTSLASPALAAETASVIRLTKTTGTVEISKSSGKSVSLLKNMRLYNGYHVVTSEESYAWINLDDSKLIKEDAESEVEVRKDGKHLEVLLLDGNLLFDVAEPLENDESMNIRTSTLAVGIRGTSGWIEIIDRWAARVFVLEGVVECSVADPVTGQVKTEAVRGGETVICTAYPQDRSGDKCDIIRQTYTVDDIPGFVLTDLTRDIPLCDKIEAETGLDIPRDLATVAGGDPSGRLPSGDAATPEVLGEADRREDEDEDALHEQLEEVQKEEEKQPDYISPDKPLNKPASPSPSENSDSGSSSGSSGGSNSGSNGGSNGDSGTTPTPPVKQGMKLTDVEVQALLDAGSSVSIPPNTDASDATPKKNTLEVDTGLTVAAGKTLDLQTGIDVEVYQGKTLRVDGTLTADALQNNGTTVVTSGDTLRLRGNLTTAGTLNVSATGRVIVDGTFTRTGTLTLASGAVVMAKSFASGAAPEGWEVSAGADANGYYTLEPAGTVTPPDPPEPVIYSVNFDGNGGAFPTGGAVQTVLQTDETGKIADWPEEPINSALSPHNSFPFIFKGWYTAAVGGDKIAPDHVFAADTQLYAHWTVNGIDWEYQASDKTIRFYGTGPTGDYPLGYTSATQEISTAPWSTDLGQAETAIIEDGITAIGEGAFATAYGDTSPMELKSVIIPDSVATIGKNAFFGCSITSITIPGSVTSIGRTAFLNCSALTNVTIPDSVTSIGESAFSNCTSLTSVTIPGSITSIENRTFFNCRALTSVTIPESVTSIGNSAFNGCTSLTSVTIPEGVATIENAAFERCSSLTRVTIPSTITAMGDSVFGYCSSLASVSISEGAKSLGRNTFNRCTSLASINIPSSVSSIEAGTFSECTGLTSVTIQRGVVTIEENAFSNCSKLASVTFPDSVTSIGDNAFGQCTGLTSVTIPSSVSSVGLYAFDGCSSLTSLSLAEGVTALWDYAFRGCSPLTSVFIPQSVTTMGTNVFINCDGLTNIYYPGTQAQWNAIDGVALAGIPGTASITYNYVPPAAP
ncbi:leucine-rich repeat protein [uncultured Oscillibacter sp.]|uniref:leucine-rich repeat protein n=1 Tax=uncultured Oscillibacter sp. TaxID=876091 RepID=UPI00272E0491|nr:leucine-rich repeat protein [uncultured Oscillibacter sp.]